MASYLSYVRRGYHTCNIEGKLALKRWSRSRSSFQRSGCTVNVHQSYFMSTTSKDKPRVNEINIQMIPEKLHEQIFLKVDTKGTFLCTINTRFSFKYLYIYIFQCIIYEFMNFILYIVQCISSKAILIVNRTIPENYLYLSN